MSGHIHITNADGILHLRMAREEKKNALTGAMYMSMVSAMKAANAEPATRVIVISAEGSMFSAGNDVMDFLKITSTMEEAPPATFIRAIATCEKPLIAAVNGAAVGVGATMLLHCDLVYASAEASLSTPFVNLALVPEAGASLLLPMRIGYQRAARMLLLAEPMSAQEALTAGLFNEIVPLDRLLDHAMAKAKILASKAPGSLATSRRLMRNGMDVLEAHMTEEMVLFGKALQSPEAREAFTAFMEKRPADFSKFG